MVKRPWDDVPHDHPVLSTGLLLACVGLAIVGGLTLKTDRKDSKLVPNARGCYVWSDGYETCKPERAYVCNANDRERGECE